MHFKSLLTRLASYPHWWLFMAGITLLSPFCGTMMGVLLLFPFYRKVKIIMKLGSSKAKIEAREDDVVSMCSARPGCHWSALKGPRAPIIIHNLSRRSSWIIVDYHDELLRGDLRNWRQSCRSLWYPRVCRICCKRMLILTIYHPELLPLCS